MANKKKRMNRDRNAAEIRAKNPPGKRGPCPACKQIDSLHYDFTYGFFSCQAQQRVGTKK